MSEIRIEKIAVRELFIFSKNAEANKNRYPVLPINAIRAFAHSKNPAAEDEDIGLIVAYYEDRCIGYLGVLPCWYKAGEKLSKVCALSTFYVDQAFRGHGAAKLIMEAAIDLGYDLILSGFTPSAEKFYRKNPQWFKPADGTNYINIRFHWLFPLLILRLVRRRIFSSSSGLFYRLIKNSTQKIDTALSHLIYYFVRPLRENWTEELTFRPASQITELQINEPPDSKAHLFRDARIINWMLRYPWIKEDSKAEPNYFFSSNREEFKFFSFELYENRTGEKKGYVVLSVSTQNSFSRLKILDSAVVDKKYLKCIFDFALREALKRQAVLNASDIFWTYSQKNVLLKSLTQNLKRGNFLVFSTKRESVFTNSQHDLRIDFCDGDIPFI
jgi:GNAT superfamily N-acetyltransferase